MRLIDRQKRFIGIFISRCKRFIDLKKLLIQEKSLIIGLYIYLNKYIFLKKMKNLNYLVTISIITPCEGGWLSFKDY
jgi:hypothetical protein